MIFHWVPEMKISVVDGSILFDAGSIGPHLDRSAFLATRIGVSARETLVNEGWVTLEFNPEPGILGTARFKDDQLRDLYFLMQISGDEARKWTEELEQERKEKHDAWLRDELGEPPYQFAWGKVISDFDPRGWVSEIIVSYASGSPLPRASRPAVHDA